MTKRSRNEARGSAASSASARARLSSMSGQCTGRDSPGAGRHHVERPAAAAQASRRRPVLPCHRPAARRGRAGRRQRNEMTSIVEAEYYLFTSESVTEGHPDKMCDQISDAILDAIIKDDPYARVACETATTTGTVMVLGEITTDTYVDFQAVIRDTVRSIGYTDAAYGFDYRTCG